jgi:hypothetical protein
LVQTHPGTSFSDQPVFSSLLATTSKRSFSSSHRLTCPSRAFIGNSPVSILHRSKPRNRFETTLLSISRSSALTAVVVLHDGVYHVPSKPARNVSTLSANRPEATPTTLRVYFAPTTLMSFNLQGLTAQRLKSVSSFLPPMPFLLSGEPENPRLRRFTPSAKRHLKTPVARRKKIPTFFVFPP